MSLDSFDYMILRELDFDSRQSYQQIADNIGKSKQFVAYRINNLLDTQTIRRYKTDINIRALGFTVFNLFIQFEGITDEREKEIFAYLRDSTYTGYLFRTIGNWDLFCSIKARSIEDFYSFMAEFHHEYKQYVNQEVINFEVRGANHFLKFLSDHRIFTKPNRSQEHGELNERDKKIVRLLREKPLASNYELSKSFEEAYNTVRRSVESLRNSGILATPRAVMNYELIGYERYLLLLNVLPVREDTSKLNRFIQDHESMDYAIDSIGRWNNIISVYVKDVNGLEQIKRGLRNLLGGSLRGIQYLRVIDSEKDAFESFF